MAGVIVIGRIFPRHSAGDAELGQHQIVGRGYAQFFPIGGRDHRGRNTPPDGLGTLTLPLGGAKGGIEGVGKVGKLHRHFLVLAVDEGQHRFEGIAGGGVLVFHVPPAGLLLFPAESHGTVGEHQPTVLLVHHENLPVAEFFLRELRHIAGPQEAPWKIAAFPVVIQQHQMRKIGVLFDIGDEIIRFPVHVIFLENHMDTGQQERRVRSRPHRHPQIGKFRDIRVVRGQVDDFSTVEPVLRGKVAVRRTGHGQVGTHHDPVGALVPVGGLGHVGLVSPHHGHDMRQIVVPLVEAEHGPPQQIGEAVPRHKAHHAHGGNGGK